MAEAGTQAFGLYSHMRSNRIRSWFLLGGLFLLVYATAYGAFLIYYGFTGTPRGVTPFAMASHSLFSWLPIVTIATIAWIIIGFRYNVGIIAAASGAKDISRTDHPELYRLLENLCISRGLKTPKLAIIDDDALNAYASGVNESQFTVSVTRGLLENLETPEIEAVLAHELTHIRNGDVRLMVIAVVIAGVISFAGELIFQTFTRGRMRFSSSSGSDRKGGGIAILAGIAIIVVAWVLAIIIRMSLSRSREYLADAGAVELTKNPDAMISALLKISGRADIQGAPSGVMDMCVENDPDDFTDLFSTHPSMTKRIQALVQTAGGRIEQPMPPRPPAIRQRQDLPTMVEARGPWHRPPTT
jgi:heat shock protein HtpX